MSARLLPRSLDFCPPAPAPLLGVCAAVLANTRISDGAREPACRCVAGPPLHASNGSSFNRKSQRVLSLRCSFDDEMVPVYDMVRRHSRVTLLASRIARQKRFSHASCTP